MEKRLFKQVIVGLVVSLILFLGGYLIYLNNKPPATCSDNIRNQKEEDIDCGGPCIPCDLKYNPPLVLAEQPYFISSDTNKIDIVFKLLNKSQEWGAKTFSYQIKLIGQNGETQTLTKSDFILPLELKTIILPLVDVSFTPSKIEIEIVKESISWEKPLSGINLSLGDPFILSNVRVI